MLNEIEILNLHVALPFPIFELLHTAKHVRYPLELQLSFDQTLLHSIKYLVYVPVNRQYLVCECLVSQLKIVDCRVEIPLLYIECELRLELLL